MEIIKDSTRKEYLRSMDTQLCYNTETSMDVINVIERAFKDRTRLIFDFGDTATGESWGEVNDIVGRIGRSTGLIKVPLLIFNNRSCGGGALLTHRVIKICTSKDKRVLYSLK